MKYQYDCVNPKSIEELEHIVDNSRQISRSTFIKNVGLENYRTLENRLGYSSGMKLKDDYYVGYSKSKTPTKKTVYYCTHSAIEHIFY